MKLPAGIQSLQNLSKPLSIFCFCPARNNYGRFILLLILFLQQLGKMVLNVLAENMLQF